MSEDHNNDHTADQYKDQYNHAGMLAFMFSMAFVLVFFVYLVAIHPGVDLGENLQKPSAAVVAAEPAVDVSQVTEPWVPNPDMVKHGAKVYQTNCAMCHGPQGMGDGAAGASLNPKPRNLVKGPWKLGGGYIGLHEVMLKGIAGGSMAAYAHFSQTDRWAVVQFIDSITEAKVTEDPEKIAAYAKEVK